MGKGWGSEKELAEEKVWKLYSIEKGTSMSTEVRNQPVPADHVASTELLKRIDRMRAALRNKIAPRPWQYGQCHLIRDNDSAHEDQRVLRHREVARDAINLIEELMDVIERGWNTAGLYDDAHTWLVSAAESASATLTDAERTKVSSQASGQDRVWPARGLKT